MDEKLLRQGLFGFDKKDVYDYISTLNERFANKMLAKDNEIASLRAELADARASKDHNLDSAQRDIQRLNDALNTMTQENLTLMERIKNLESDRDKVLTLIIKAEQDSRRIVSEAESQAAILLSEAEQKLTAKKLEMLSISEDVKRLKGLVASIAVKYNSDLEQALSEYQTSSQIQL